MIILELFKFSSDRFRLDFLFDESPLTDDLFLVCFTRSLSAGYYTPLTMDDLPLLLPLVLPSLLDLTDSSGTKLCFLRPNLLLVYL